MTAPNNTITAAGVLKLRSIYGKSTDGASVYFSWKMTIEFNSYHEVRVSPHFGFDFGQDMNISTTICEGLLDIIIDFTLDRVQWEGLCNVVHTDTCEKRLSTITTRQANAVLTVWSLHCHYSNTYDSS